MLDIKLLRDQGDAIRQNLEDRNVHVFPELTPESGADWAARTVERLQALDARYLELLHDGDETRRKQNENTTAMKSVGKLPKAEQAAARKPLIEAGRALRDHEREVHALGLMRDRRRQAPPVVHDDIDGLLLADHVGVREDQAVVGDDESRAEALCGVDKHHRRRQSFKQCLLRLLDSCERVGGRRRSRRADEPADERSLEDCHQDHATERRGYCRLREFRTDRSVPWRSRRSDRRRRGLTRQSPGAAAQGSAH